MNIILEETDETPDIKAFMSQPATELDLKTIMISVGNDGDHLTQEKWADLAFAVNEVVADVSFHSWPVLHSASASRQQVTAWVFTLESRLEEGLRDELALVVREYNTSILWREQPSEHLVLPTEEQ